MSVVFDAIMGGLAALSAQAKEGRRRRQAQAVRIPHHPVLAVLFLATAVMFLVVCGYFAVITTMMLTDDLVMFLGAILAPLALTGLFAALQFTVWAVRYSVRSFSS